jgi:6-pyruvoyltetrahydropterin/6-carboxytetrahydropterin synthase
MPIIVQRLEFDAGHRLLKHEGKCRNVHGHRYVVEVEIQAPALDAVGRVLDFGQVKRLLGGWLDDNWDHGFIAEHGDPIIPFLIRNGQKHDVLPVAPTAENMVATLGEDFQNELNNTFPGSGLTLLSVQLWETPNCRAVWRAPAAHLRSPRAIVEPHTSGEARDGGHGEGAL